MVFKRKIYDKMLKWKNNEKYSERIDRKYLIYTKDLGKDKDVIFLPVYLVPFLT